MEEKKFINFKKEELGVKEFVKRTLGKGRISNVTIEYTPVGEKIIVSTNKPGLVIGRKGEKIELLTTTLKRKFKLDNPHVEINEILDKNLDAQLVADEIALTLERQGSLRFKVTAYRALKDIIRSGARGVELVLAGKLPSDRARTWRFKHGYLKKTGFPSKVVEKGMAQAKTASGTVGIKVSILAPDAHIHDRITINDELKEKIKANKFDAEEAPKKKEPAKKKATKKKKIEDKK